MKPAWSFALGVAVSSVAIVGTVEYRHHRAAIRTMTAADPTVPVAPIYPGIHQAILEAEKRDPPGVLFIGDSITDFWRTVPWVWQEAFGEFHPCNAGISFDQTQHTLWRVEHGELDGIKPRVVVLLIGTNNIGIGHDDASLTAVGILHLGGVIQQRLPDTKILLLGLLPRQDQYADEARKCNTGLAGVNDEHAEYFNPGAQLTDDDFADGLHLSPAGFQHLAKLLAPKIAELYRARPTTAP
jgi:lysophospholipase L1-like esterase